MKTYKLTWESGRSVPYVGHLTAMDESQTSVVPTEIATIKADSEGRAVLSQLVANADHPVKDGKPV